MESQAKLKQIKANWYIRNRKRLLAKQKVYYKVKQQEKNMKKTNKSIILSFD
jgi:hypothetical protein